jgi:predicted small lipoprotein YifL
MKRSVKALTFAAAAAAGLTISGCWGFGGTVYGPPPETSDKPATRQTESKETKETDVTLPSDYDPTLEPEVDVYGPPPDSPD